MVGRFEVVDELDRGYSPPESWSAAQGFGNTPYEEASGETLEQRIAQEEPEEGTAYGAPEPEGILGGADDLSGEGVDGRGPDDRDMVGGDDPDAIPADRDVLDGGV